MVWHHNLHVKLIFISPNNKEQILKLNFVFIQDDNDGDVTNVRYNNT